MFFETEKCTSSNCFLFQDDFDNSGLLDFPYIFLSQVVSYCREASCATPVDLVGGLPSFVCVHVCTGSHACVSVGAGQAI